MKIFISHASANKEYGDALVELLRGIGVGEDEIIYTSNTAYGIPLSQNIFKWLKTQISEKPFVIYLLSKQYYASIACLNEMGAAWIVENEHAIIFTPGFQISSKEFQNGAIDPREIGFYLDNQERLLEFIEIIKKHFEISSKSVIIHQAVSGFLKKISNLVEHPPQIVDIPEASNHTLMGALESKSSKDTKQEIEKADTSLLTKTSNKQPVGLYQKFITEISTNKLKDEELMLLHYLIESGKVKLGVGWQEPHEISKIVVWEEVNELGNMLSSKYNTAISKFEVRGYTEVSALTASNNPKEVKLKSEIAENLLDLPEPVLGFISRAINRYRGSTSTPDDDDLPF